MNGAEFLNLGSSAAFLPGNISGIHMDSNLDYKRDIPDLFLKTMDVNH
jgi:hypothetical protein